MFQGCSESLTQCNLQNISQESRHRCNTCFPRIIWLGSSIFCSKINTEKSDRERQVSYDITYIGIENTIQMNLFIITETDSQTQRTNLQLAKGQRGEREIRSMRLTDTRCYI